MASEGEVTRVAVMGATGSGKSTFINVASGSRFATSDSLSSCTTDVETSTLFLDGRTVTLIDVPGFDNTTRSDTDILESITDCLCDSHSQEVKLAGMIYVHRINDHMGGRSRRNFRTFCNLCGDAGLQNALLVTNMWSQVDPHEGAVRERELASKEKFFKPALDRGARMLRHDGSQASAHTILRHLVNREPSVVVIQDEMLNQERDLADTTVGSDIIRELKEQAELHAEALDDLCLGIEAARLAEDGETREILQGEARKARERIEQIRGDLERMVTNFAAENSRLKNENWEYKKGFRKQRGDAEAQPIADESREHEKREREKQERNKQEREKQEKETQGSNFKRPEREREEWERQKRELRQKVLQHAKEVQKRMQQELEGLEVADASHDRGCLIQ